MAKIAMIGAGSIVFCKTLLNDLMATPALRGSTFALVNRTAPKLERMATFARQMVRDNSLDAKITATLDRHEALDGADYVINMIQVGGLTAAEADYEIPRRYGVDQCVGDTLAPGGVFRALRTIPVVLDIARDMEALCPRALLLNYANPMAMVCWALGEQTRLRFLGLCHGVQTTLDLISRYVGVPKNEIDYLCAGINHMAWFLKLEQQGRDLYPTLREKVEKPEYYKAEKVRCEVMRQLGYFMTESTGHLSEYLPWFRSSTRALETYCDEPEFGGESGAALRWARLIAQKFPVPDPFLMDTPALQPRSVEYCSYIIEAMETDRVFRLNGNVRNTGLISNLPDGCCV
ncbi:MAG TPA: alpha-glucosidase/alpha-galactosidase, partial [Armatimonadota bacterium]|nr:alpha-glucosidase/alpha-galactosidase [Armatimonadota bacterium]